MIAPEFHGMTQKQQIETGMTIINTLSLPPRVVEAAVSAACKSHPAAEKVCRTAGSVIQSTKDVISPYIPQPVKNLAGDLSTRLNQLPSKMEKAYGIPQSETAYCLESAGLIGSSLLFAGAGKAIQSTASAIKQSNTVQKIFNSAANSNSPYVSGGTNKITFLPSGSLEYTPFKRADGSMTVFVDYLKAKKPIPGESGLKMASTSKEAISFLKNYASKDGATSLYLQWYPQNQRLLELAHRWAKADLSYIGKGQYPLRSENGLFPAFKVESYTAPGDASGLFYYGLGAPSTAAFIEGVQANGLTGDFNRGNTDKPIPERGASGAIGGVGNTACIVEGLFSSLKELEENHHLFFIPTSEGKQPFKIEDLEQIVRELAVGIYVFDAVPCFSLHFDPDTNMFPVIHPCYRRTLVGKVIGLLDYYMKGFLHGAFFDEKFIREWLKSPTHDKQFLKNNSIDLRDYCQTHLGSDMDYMSMYEILDALEQEKIGEGQKNPDESPVLSDFKQCGRSSVRINAKQNSIRKWENLFMLDGGFDMDFTFSPDPEYVEELRKYRSEHGCDPAGYTRMMKAFNIMKHQIETIMPRLPMFQELFNKLNVINFFSYYFINLKEAQKVAVFASKSINHDYGCPPKFPHHPIRRIQRQKFSVDLEQVFKGLTEKEKQVVESYLKTAKDFSDLPAHVLAAIGPSFKKCLNEKAPHPLSEEDASPSKHKQTILNFMKYLAERTKSLMENAQSTKKTLLERQQYLQETIKNLTTLRDNQKIENQKGENSVNQYKKIDQNLIAQKTTLEKDRAKYTPESVNKALGEINANIATVQGTISELTKQQGEMAVHLKKIEDDIAKTTDDLKKISTLIKDVDKTLQTSLDLSAKHLSAPFIFSKPTVQLFSELPEEERLLTRRFVGGCGMNMESVPLISDPASAEIITSTFSTIIQTPAEEWIAFKNSEDGQASGYLLKLNVADFPATGGKDYDWLQFSTIQESPDTAMHKAATFSALHSGDFPLFRKLIQRDDCRKVTDPNGFSIIHYAAVNPSSQYLKEIMSVWLDRTMADDPSTLNAGVKKDTKAPLGYTPLHCAAAAGNIENMKLLFHFCFGKDSAVINLRAENGETPLNLAVQYNHLDAVKFLIQKGANVNNRMAHGMTPLYSAIHNGLKEIALFLMDVSGVDLNCPLENGTTAVYLAAELEELEILSKLIAKGADINRARIDTYTPLHIVAKKGSLQTLQVLFQHPHINPNCQLKSGRTALHLAAEHNHPSVVQFLLQKRTDPFLCGWDQETPLLTAAAHGNVGAVSHLLKYDKGGVLINKPNLKGETPVIEAIRGRFYEILDILFKHKLTLSDPKEFLLRLCEAKVDPQFIRSWIDQNKLTKADIQKAYYISAQAGHNQMVSLFRRIYKLEDFLDNDGWTPAHFAAKYDHLNLVQEFLKTPRDLKKKDKAGNTLAAIAALHGSHRVLKLLIEAMKDDTFENHYRGAHLLLAAVKEGKQECAELIIYRFKHPNFSLDNVGRTAAHIAALNGDVEMLDFLRTHGGRFDISDKNKKTPFHYAFEYRWKDAIDYLLNRKYELDLPSDLLAFVSAHGTKEQVLMLLQKGFAPNESGSPKEEPPLFHAIQYGRTENFLALCDNGADLEISFDGLTPLLFTAKEGASDIIPILLLKGVQNSKDLKGNSALHWAVKMGHEECVAALIKGGINPLEKNNEGLTPIDIAKKERFSHLLYYLQGKENELLRIKSSIITSLESGDEQRFFQLIKDLPLNEPISFDIGGKKETLPLLYLAYLKSKNQNILKRFMGLPGVKKTASSPEKGTIYHLMAARGEKIDYNQIDPCIQNKQGISILHLQARQGKIECLRDALDNTKNVDIEDKEGQTPLDYSIQAKNQDNVSLLLQKGADPNHQSHNKSGPLVFAIEKDLTLICRLLLKHGANVNQSFSYNRQTPLHLAIEKKGVEIVKLLIAHGADVNKEDLFGVRPIHLAARHGGVSLIRMLHAAGASLNAKDHDGKTVAHWAAKSKEKGVLEYLKEAEVVLNKQTKIVKPTLRETHPQMQGLSPLHLAAEKGNSDSVQILVKNGCDPKALVEDHFGPLFYATKSGNVEVLNLFIGMGLTNDTDQKALAIRAAIVRDAVQQLKFFYTPSTPIDLCLDKNGTTGLQIAAKSNAKRCLHYFIKRKADPQKPDLHGETAFEIAVKTNHLAIVFYLIKYIPQIDLNRKLKEGKSYLHLACEMDNCETAAWLIENKLSLEETDDKGLTPLHYGAKQGNYPLVHLLLACGANPNKQTPQNLSPSDLLSQHASSLKSLFRTYQEARKLRKETGESRLHTAIRLNDVKHFPLLLKLTDKNRQGKSGETPLHLAVCHPDPYFFRVLLENGANFELKNSQGQTPLATLATSGYDIYYAKSLIELGADVCVTDIQDRTLLHAITLREDKIMAEKFFDLIYKTIPKSKLEQFSSDDMVYAIKSKNINNFFYLINAGFPLKKTLNSLLRESVINGADKLAICLLSWFKASYDKNLIELSYRFKQKAVFEALCQYKKKKRTRDEKSLQQIIQHNDLTALFDFSNYYIDFNQIAQENSNTLLHAAAKSNSPTIAEFLIWFGLDPNARNKLENTPLHLAANFNNISVAQLLLDKGADPHLTNNNGWTPLSLALQTSINPDLVLLFRNKNVDINFSFKGYSQTQRAANFNKPIVLKNLLMLGARFLPFELKEKNKSEINLIVQKMHIDALKAVCTFACENKDQYLLKDLKQLYVSVSDEACILPNDKKATILSTLTDYSLIKGTIL